MIIGTNLKQVLGQWTKETNAMQQLHKRFYLLISKRPNSKPHAATRQQAIAKTPAKRSADQIPSVIVVYVMLVFKVYFVSLISKGHKRL
jgi:hypothetical protein